MITITTGHGHKYRIAVVALPGMCPRIELHGGDITTNAWPAGVVLHSDDGGKTNALHVGSAQIGPIGRQQASIIKKYLTNALAELRISWQADCWSEE